MSVRDNKLVSDLDKYIDTLIELKGDNTPEAIHVSPDQSEALFRVHKLTDVYRGFKIFVHRDK